MSQPGPSTIVTSGEKQGPYGPNLGWLSAQVESTGEVMLRDRHGRALFTDCNHLREIVRRMDAYLANPAATTTDG